VPAAPRHPFVRCIGPPLCGPILAPAGATRGAFSFETRREQARYCLEFAWQRESGPFEMAAEVNGFSISVCGDDPWPRPIDVTAFIPPWPAQNVLDFKIVRAPERVVMAVREYKLVTLTAIVAEMVGVAVVNPLRDVITAKGPRCAHRQTFPLAKFLTEGIVAGRWTCPVCGNEIAMEEAVVVAYMPQGAP